MRRDRGTSGLESAATASAESGWPVARTETRDWVSSIGGLSGRQRSRISPTYEAAVLPPIADISSIDLPGDLIADLAEAEATIERFDATIGSSLSGFAVIALRTEAVASSRIENLSATATSIALAEHLPKTARTRSNAEAISANVATLRTAMHRDGDIATGEIEEIQRILLAEHAPKLVGLRAEQVWIGGTVYSPHDADYIAPHHDRVPAALDDWAIFANRRDLGRLAHIAVSHAHFENIHPFADGNGRTGRVIVQRQLRTSGLTRETVLPVSAGLLTDLDRYFDALTAYRDGDVSAIVAAFTDAAFATAANANSLAEELTEIRDRWSEMFTVRADSAVWPLLDYALQSPAISATVAAEALTMTPHRVRAGIEQLEAAGIAHTNSASRRNRVWLVTDVIDALERFMDRTRRPRTG
jgi:Fic family protein